MIFFTHDNNVYPDISFVNNDYKALKILGVIQRQLGGDSLQ